MVSVVTEAVDVAAVVVEVVVVVVVVAAVVVVVVVVVAAVVVVVVDTPGQPSRTTISKPIFKWLMHW